MSDEVRKITIQLRGPRGRDAGKVAVGHYCIADGFVVLCDENGRPTGDGKRTLSKDGDAHLIACAMLRSSRRYGNSRPAGFGFGEPLHYQKLKY